ELKTIMRAIIKNGLKDELRLENELKNRLNYELIKPQPDSF
ncbi:38847_t:CDS:1, partial [Gigaspora margarita]